MSLKARRSPFCSLTATTSNLEIILIMALRPRMSRFSLTLDPAVHYLVGDEKDRIFQVATRKLLNVFSGIWSLSAAFKASISFCTEDGGISDILCIILAQTSCIRTSTRFELGKNCKA